MFIVSKFTYLCEKEFPPDKNFLDVGGGGLYNVQRSNELQFYNENIIIL